MAVRDIFQAPSPEDYMNMCKDIYLLKLDEVLQRVNETNAHYGGLNFDKATKIVIVNGDYDPWRLVSFPSNNNTDPFGVTSILVPNAGHCPYKTEVSDKVKRITSEWLKRG